MARSVWKGPFVEESLIKKAEKQKNETNKKPIKTWSRKSTIIPDFIGLSFLILHRQDNFLDILQRIKRLKKKKLRIKNTL